MEREAPSASAPPAYARFIPSRAVRKDLRPAVLLVAAFSCVYGVIAAAAVLRRRDNYGGHLPNSLDTIYLVLAVLYCVCAAIEAFGVAAAYRASIRLVRTYFYGAASVALIVTAAEVLRLVVHFTQKSAILKACADSYATDVTSGSASTADVTAYCQASWQNATYLDVALLVFSLIVSFFFASLAASYLHQLKNPSVLRTHTPSHHFGPAASAQYSVPPYGHGVPLEPYPSAGVPPSYPYSANPYPAAAAPGAAAPSYDNPYGFKPPTDDKDHLSSTSHVELGGAQDHNPFDESVQYQPQPHHHHQTQTLLVRRPGETVEEFEERQHEHDQQQQQDDNARFGRGESTETVTLEGGGRRV
ncbi:hypothetical protein JCM11491_000327 [Sporobolomyces phaffii]